MDLVLESGHKLSIFQKPVANQYNPFPEGHQTGVVTGQSRSWCFQTALQSPHSSAEGKSDKIRLQKKSVTWHTGRPKEDTAAQYLMFSKYKTQKDWFRILP